MITPDVRPGQIWADLDDRSIRIEHVGPETCACMALPAGKYGQVIRVPLVEFARGGIYRLVQDAPATEPEGCDELLDEVERALSDAEPGPEQECGYSYDHDARADDTECRRCGADLSAWVSDEPTATEGSDRP